MFVQDEPGVLARVSGCLAARGVNIDSLVVCTTDVRDLSRMCIVLRGQDGTIEQVRRQLEDLVPVWAVVDYTDTKVIEREIMLVKLSTLGPEYFEKETLRTVEDAAELEVEHAAAPTDVPMQRELSPTEALSIKSDNFRSITALTEQFHGRVVDVSDSCMIVELSAKTTRCDAFLKLVRPFGVLECSRSGTSCGAHALTLQAPWCSHALRLRRRGRARSTSTKMRPPRGSMRACSLPVSL